MHRSAKIHDRFRADAFARTSRCAERNEAAVWCGTCPNRFTVGTLPVHTGEQTTAQSSPPSRRSGSSSCVVCVQLHHNIVNYKAVIKPYRSDPVPARAGTFSFSFSPSLGFQFRLSLIRCYMYSTQNAPHSHTHVCALTLHGITWLGLNDGWPHWSPFTALRGGLHRSPPIVLPAPT